MQDALRLSTGQEVVVETAGLAMTMATRFLALGLRTLGSLRLMSYSSSSCE